MTETKMTGRDILEEAIKQYDKTYCDSFLSIDKDLPFDEECEKNLRKLMRRLNNPFRLYFNTAGKRVAGIVAVFLLAFTCSMTVSAVRKPVVEFITNVYEKCVEFIYGEENLAKAPNTIETVYTLGVIPDGYEMDQFIIDTLTADMTWKNENDDRLVLSQGILFGSIVIDAEESGFEVITWNGEKFTVVEKHGIKSIIWYTDEYEFSLTMPSDISNEDAFVLIDSIVKYNQ